MKNVLVYTVCIDRELCVIAHGQAWADQVTEMMRFTDVQEINCTSVNSIEEINYAEQT